MGQVYTEKEIKQITDAIPDIEEKKISETTISSWIETHPEYEEALEESLEASYRVDMLQAAGRTPLADRKERLSDLVKLWIGGYWGDPKIERQTKEEFEKTTYRKMQEQQINGLQDIKEDLEQIKNKPKLKRKE